MIEDFLNVKLDPKEIFGEVSDEELIKTARELGWGQASIDHLENSRKEVGFRSDMYIYYALYKGKQEGLIDTDLFSFAGLISGLISGLHGGFGTDTYKKEEIIEYRAIDEYNLLVKSKADPLTIARVIVEFCLEQYKVITVERQNLMPKNYTLREDQIRLIHDYTVENGKKNDSEGLRDVIDAGLKFLIVKD
jgi:hypothetical protein